MPCLFCRSSGPLTSEHVFPAWLGGHLGTGPVTHNYIPWRAAVAARSYQSKQLSITANAVCGPCNSGWMSVLESDVAPVLAPLVEGEERVLAATAREVLASWATTFVRTDRQGEGAERVRERSDA